MRERCDTKLFAANTYGSRHRKRDDDDQKKYNIKNRITNFFRLFFVRLINSRIMVRCPAGVRTKSVFSISPVYSKLCSQVSQTRVVAHCFYAFISPHTHTHYKSPNSVPELPSTTIPINNNNESARHRYPGRMRQSGKNDNVTDEDDDDNDKSSPVYFFAFIIHTNLKFHQRHTRSLLPLLRRTRRPRPKSSLVVANSQMDSRRWKSIRKIYHIRNELAGFVVWESKIIRFDALTQLLRHRRWFHKHHEFC